MNEPSDRGVEPSDRRVEPGSGVEPDRVHATGGHIRMVSRGGWEYVERVHPCGLVCIAAITGEDEIVLVEQHRPPVGRSVIELPAGIVGDQPGESADDLLGGARRELLEETGFRAREWTLAASGPPSAGLTTEVLHVFVARDLERVGEGGGDAEEDIRVHVVPLARLDDWLREAVARGALVDLKIYTGLWCAGITGSATR